MSGRLIILPKKTYTPWNPQNIERVTRDERLHKERLEKEEEERRRRANRNRIREMKDRIKKKSTTTNNSTNTSNSDNDDNEEEEEEKMSIQDEGKGGVDSIPCDLKHINLFEREEKEMMRSITNGSITCTKSAIEKLEQKSVGIIPVFLTECPGKRESHQRTKRNSTGTRPGDKLGYNNAAAAAISLSPSRPFYKRTDCLRKDIDDKVKVKLDPMGQFTSNRHQSKIYECNKETSINRFSQDRHDDYISTTSSSSPAMIKKRKKKKYESKSSCKSSNTSSSRSKKRHNAKEETCAKKIMKQLLARKQFREKNELDRERDLRKTF